MKNSGAISDFKQQKEDELIRAYRDVTAVCRYVSYKKALKEVVNRPASRFWVSSSRATIVVAKILRGDKLSQMRSTKREMFNEISRRVVLLRTQRPDEPLSSLVEEIVLQPAPKFYMAPGSAHGFIVKARKSCRQRRLQK